MGKSKKQKHHTQSSHPHPYHNPSTTTTKKLPRRLPTKPQPTTTKKPHPPPPTIIPFHPTHRILLVGEGDFSFTHSLYKTHNCTSLTATCHDSAGALAEKYPQSRGYIRELLEDAVAAASTITGHEDEEAEGDEDDDMEKKKKEIKILYGVDATKLGKAGAGSGGKAVRKGGFDRIVFNFPHVGGVTRDVNRQ
ncbi:MAG: hypothetical protein Q9182_003077, partial [Xanthomendoza sp. 2 TL-2023]